jgi:hypothetical protein
MTVYVMICFQAGCRLKAASEILLKIIQLFVQLSYGEVFFDARVLVEY